MYTQSYEIPSAPSAAETITFLRHNAVRFLTLNNSNSVISRNVIATNTGDDVYVEIEIVDGDIFYAVGPTLSGTLPQVNTQSAAEATRLLEYAQNFDEIYAYEITMFQKGIAS